MASNQEGRQINSAVQGPKIPHSHFTLNKRVGVTSKFGVNEPIYCTELVSDDGPFTIEPNCDIRSYTLKAPMIGTIQKHVSAYQVPLQSILPFNWDKIVKNPTRGTDVVGDSQVEGLVPCLDGVNTVISAFASKLWTAFTSDFSAYKTNFPDVPVAGDTMSSFINSTLTFILKYELFYSQGSLISRLGAHFGANVYFNIEGKKEKISFDNFSELLLSNVLRYSFGVVDDNASNSVPVNSGVKHVRRVLDFMRSHKGPFRISSPSFIGPSSVFDIEKVTASTYVLPNDSEPYNYGRCCAYQLVNAHFFTNGKIDYINTADLYRQHISSLLQTAHVQSALIIFPQTFDYNGVSTYFDYLSGLYISECLDSYLSNSVIDSSFFWNYTYPLISAIFGFNYSLRYMDYFVGARPKNLAVGDTSIRVDNNQVQVVDVTKNIVKQRFLNAVARVSNTIEEYSNKILGKRLEYDYHNPKYLFSFDANVFTSEVENTGSAQVTDENSVTAVMRGNFKNHQFTFSVDRHSYVILIEYTDFARFYYTTQDRKTMAIDRFDMFVPELQYVGDQELRRSELLAGANKEMPFAYTLRDMQFKQEVDECSGGFIDFLPGWLFKYNPFDRYEGDLNSLVISPEFIRSQPTELDDFYLKLSNMSLAGYFHFIEMWDIKISANRPMAYAPQIL